MKSFRALILAACTSAIMASCSGEDNPLDKIEFYPVMVEGYSNWSFVGHDGIVTCHDAFASQPSCVVDGFFSVREDGAIAVYRLEDGDAEPVESLTGLLCAGFFHDGMIGVVKSAERITFANRKGHTVLTLDPVDGKEIVEAGIRFCNGRLPVKLDNGKWGYVDRKGRLAIPADYDDASPFSDGYAHVLTSDAMCIIDTDGNELLRFARDFRVKYLRDNMLILRENADGHASWRFIDIKNGDEWQTPASVMAVGQYHDGLFAFMDTTGKWGLMATDGETVVPAQYTGLFFSEDHCNLLAQEPDGYVLLDTGGNEISQLPGFSQIQTIKGEGFHYFGRHGDSWLLLGKDGDISTAEEFSAFGMSASLCKSLVSDYFPVDELVGELIALTSGKSFGRYPYGSNPSDYVTEAERYINIPYFIPAAEESESTPYSIAVSKVTCSEIIADLTYEYDNDWCTGYTYGFNPGSKINGGTMTVSAGTRDLWGKVKTPLAQALADKGYIAEKDEENTISLRSTADPRHDTVVTIERLYSGFSITVCRNDR